MFDYWLYGGDLRFLAERAYPFMLEAWKVYEAMLEETTTADGTRRFSLPVSVSPEYRGHRMNAWGRDASFQLAAIHWLLEALGRAAAALGITPNPRWAQVAASLPKACVHDQHILLWEGTDLEESHRHHSHLAGITPFDVIDPVDPAWADICQRSARRWIEKGMGLWTGWCMPWAASLHARFGHTVAAQELGGV